MHTRTASLPPNFLITHAGSRLGSAWVGWVYVCVCVCNCVRAVKEKRLELLTPNLV